MKLKLASFLIVALLPLLSLAQGSSLSIFSEDGGRFILFLNGAQQNNVSQANLRLDGLTQPYYKAKIVFDDNTKGPVEKNIQVVDPSTNAPADVVYKMKSKDGEMKLRYFSAQPIQPNYTPPADVHVMHYGQPDQVTTTTQTTVTTTGANPGNGSVTFGMGAGAVNITAVPNTDNNATQTTTATTENNTNTQQPAAPVVCQNPMDWNNFKSAKKTIADATFEDTKLSAAKAILSSNCLLAEQVIQVCHLFGFEETKLKFAKLAYPKTTDQGNYSKVASVFTFNSSKTSLNNFIANGGR